MSPLEITMLLHIHTIAAPIQHIEYPAQKKAIREFMRCGLIEEAHTDRYPSGYCVTSKGKYVIDVLCSIPIE
jgi:hypothetical protein